MKFCNTCQTLLPLTAFDRRAEKNSRLKLRSNCKVCRRRAKRAAKLCPRVRVPPQSPEERRRRARLRDRKAYEKRKFSHGFSSQVRKSLKGGKHGAAWERLVGYDAATLRRHLEKQFTRTMSWDNYGTHWHIDHIVPVSAFKFESSNDPDFMACWALTNLRPYPARKNLQKHAQRLHLL